MDSKEEYLGRLLEKANTYELLVHSPVWGYIKEFIDKRTVAFETEALGKGFKSMEEYQFERGKVVGLSLLLSEVDSALETLRNERNKADKKSTE